MSDYRSRPPSPAPRRALDALLGGAAGGDPIRRALWLDELDRRLRPLLPPALAAHARLANVDGDRLVFLVDSPVWHARLRLASSDLLDAARSLGLDVTRVVARTTRQIPGTPPPPGPALPGTTSTPQGLREALAVLHGPSKAPGSDGS